MHPYVKIAHDTIQNRLAGRALPVAGADFPQTRAAVFVTLHRKGELRGCIGTLIPRFATIDEEIKTNAISAAFEDPRFLPLTEKELPELVVSVDVLSRPEPIRSEADLDPKTYGVIVESGKKRGVLLPDLEGVDTVAYQIAIARNKANIRDDEKIQLYRFTVTRHE